MLIELQKCCGEQCAIVEFARVGLKLSAGWSAIDGEPGGRQLQQ